MDLVPDETGCCTSCGSKWDNRNPIEQGWIASDSTCIIKPTELVIDRERKTYFRPCSSRCGCKKYYQGVSDLLFNVNNYYLMYFDTLYTYLCCLIDHGNPLVAMQRTMNMVIDVVSSSEPLKLWVLQRAWHSFSRQLDINLENNMYCNICKEDPEVIICDGTSVGVRKDMLSSVKRAKPETTPINGSKHNDRTFISNAALRNKLKAFVQGISQRNFDNLLKSLKKEQFTAIAGFIEEHCISVGRSRNVKLDPKFSKLFSQLLINGPVCGVMQISEDESLAQDVLSEIVKSKLDIRLAQNAKKAQIIQSQVPLLYKQLTDPNLVLDESFLLLLEYIITKINAPFEIGTTDLEYPPPTEQITECFPNLPKIHDPGNYTADKASSAPLSDCRKESYGHPVLSPGIFTIFCEHGICYGYSLMDSCESPRMPFEILKTRFKVPPKIIIYDNACKLHSYCLNREPIFFKNTKFFVDRFHFKGHKGCSEGYSLNSYVTIDKQAINTQVNEQANAGIQKLKGHVSYMTVKNFMHTLTLYICGKNYFKNKQIMYKKSIK